MMSIATMVTYIIGLIGILTDSMIIVLICLAIICVLLGMKIGQAQKQLDSDLKSMQDLPYNE